MKGWIAEIIEPSAEKVGLALLLLVLVPVMFIFCGASYLLDESLHNSLESATARPGVEFVAVPLAALLATIGHFGADRVTALRAGRLGPWLPLLMATALVALTAYVVWSWDTRLNSIGPDVFGVVRWLGTMLVAVFTTVALPLFPRIVATLSGAIAVPAGLALMHNTLFGAHELSHTAGSDGSEGAFLFVGLIATPVWILGASWLSQGGRPMFQAAWSATIMLCLAILGGIAG
ncbi:MAG: hypothetical protein OXH19_09065 [Chloroflexi bacterium]|nr:hypothetical protein [Chloroflexota bacterium]MCY3587692.1 hypothetical protein [Chloroflexota bacterium]MCY3686309.1 hypothetical protein [Chloroflexota bacterium]MDE2708930.1 hypothetical protein [Chloroflexota bacterium]